jgi:hypothetical protein
MSFPNLLEVLEHSLFDLLVIRGLQKLEIAQGESLPATINGSAVKYGQN